MVRQEDLKGMQFLRHALDVVEPINTHNQLDSLKLLLERSDAFLYLGLLKTL